MNAPIFILLYVNVYLGIFASFALYMVDVLHKKW